MKNAESYLDLLRRALADLPEERLADLGELLYRAYRNEKQVFTLGNGGSASTASHMAADITKNTISPHMRRFRVLSLNDNTALVTALANDLGYEHIFSEQLRGMIRAGDLLIVLSGSGNSANVLAAIHCARERSAVVAGVLGFDGGEAAGLVDLAIVVPSDHYGVIEDVHLVINHIIVDYFRDRLLDEQPWVV